MKFSIAIIFSVLLVLSITEAEALRNDKQEIIKNFDSFDRTITLNPNLATPERIERIESVVMSKEVIKLDDNWQHKGPVGVYSDWFPGWLGALNTIKPTDLSFKVSGAPGDISINLLETKSDISGEMRFYGERAVITIYDVNSYTLNSLEALVRHELGHAFGLGHTSAPEEMMNEIITSAYPFISPCNLQALQEENKREVKCEK